MKKVKIVEIYKLDLTVHWYTHIYRTAFLYTYLFSDVTGLPNPISQDFTSNFLFFIFSYFSHPRFHEKYRTSVHCTKISENFKLYIKIVKTEMFEMKCVLKNTLFFFCVLLQ